MLHPLRIPAGWAVITNWFDERPFFDNHDENIFYYSDDCLLIEQVAYGKLGRFWSTFPESCRVQVSWYSPANPAGAYGLVFSKAAADPTTAADIILLRFESREKQLVQEKIDLCLRLGTRALTEEELRQLLAETAH